MGKTLYLECTSGISGDMTVAALLDLGADRAALEQALQSLPLSGYQVKISRVSKSGLDACDFAVLLDEAHENHDHDMAYLYSPHSHASAPHHNHSHSHHHEHRGLPEILELLNAGALTPSACALAVRIFTILAEAEAKAHGVPAEQVHFHEVGAVDSIVDITAAAVCLDNLGIDRVILPVLCDGTGSIRCQHGVIPVPVPATLNIVSAYGLPLRITEVQGELVTPTGAAIAAALQPEQTLPPRFRVERVGLGAGKRQYERPSLLRAMLITEDAPARETIWKLETNVDDCTGEALGFLLERLLEAGAKDVFYTPVYMKKNRPGWLLTALCDEERIPALEGVLFRESTTIGVRRTKMERTILPRRTETRQTPLGPADYKVCTLPDGSERSYPEYESAAALCRTTGRPWQEVWQILANG